MLKDIEYLAAAGCKFVRLAHREKRPLSRSWHTKATGECGTVEYWLRQGSNIGLLLGPASGVVDVEFDEADGLEQLAAFGITDLTTPTWRSARGEHRLFRWESWMPQTAVVKAGALEIRLGGRAAQSVLPPSTHPTGERYEWIVPPSIVSIAPFPAQLLRGVACNV